MNPVHYLCVNYYDFMRYHNHRSLTNGTAEHFNLLSAAFRSTLDLLRRKKHYIFHFFLPVGSTFTKCLFHCEADLEFPPEQIHGKR